MNRYYLRRLMPMLSLLITLSMRGQTSPWDFWQWRNPLPSNQNLTGVAYGNGVFAAVTDAGSIFESADGTQWKNLGIQAAGGLEGLTFDHNLFVAVGRSSDGLTGSILTSRDGLAWSAQNASAAAALHAVVWGGGHFVTVGDTGTIRTSADGTNWTSRTSSTTNRLHGVSYGTPHWVAVGEAGTVLASVDGTNWTSQPASVSGTLTSVAYGNGRFAAVGPTNVALTSANGTNWVQHPTATNNRLNSVAFLNSAFFAVGPNGLILTSPDGSSWMPQTSGSTHELSAIALGDGTFAAVGAQGTILTSSAGQGWTARNSGSLRNILGIAYGNGVFVAVGGVARHDPGFPKPAPLLLVSPDGTNWKSQSLATNLDLYGVTYANNTFVIAGNAGLILTSPDATNWSIRTAGTVSSDTNAVPPVALGAVAYGNGTFVAVTTAWGDTVLTSTDGAAWTKTPFLANTVLNRVRYLNAVFLGTGFDSASKNGLLEVSTDGTNWTTRMTPGVGVLNDSAYGHGTFLAVGAAGSILISTDALDWTAVYDAQIGTNRNIVSVIYQASQFIAVDDEGDLFTSMDGTGWLKHQTPGIAPVQTLAFGSGTLVAGGLLGTIWQSAPILQLEGAWQAPTFDLTLSGEGVTRLRLQASSDLSSWIDLVTLTNAGRLQYSDTNSPAIGRRFYRAVIP